MRVAEYACSHMSLYYPVERRAEVDLQAGSNSLLDEKTLTRRREASPSMFRVLILLTYFSLLQDLERSLLFVGRI